MEKKSSHEYSNPRFRCLVLYHWAAEKPTATEEITRFRCDMRPAYCYELRSVISNALWQKKRDVRSKEMINFEYSRRVKKSEFSSYLRQYVKIWEYKINKVPIAKLRPVSSSGCAQAPPTTHRHIETNRKILEGCRSLFVELAADSYPTSHCEDRQCCSHSRRQPADWRGTEWRDSPSDFVL